MFAKTRFLKSLDFFVLKKFKIKKEINFIFQCFQIKPSFTALYNAATSPVLSRLVTYFDILIYYLMYESSSTAHK